MDELKFGTRVKYKVDPLEGTGKVVGISNSGVVFLGRGYIIEPDKPINNTVYDYSHFVVFERFLEVIEEVNLEKK